MLLTKREVPFAGAKKPTAWQKPTKHSPTIAIKTIEGRFSAERTGFSPKKVQRNIKILGRISSSLLSLGTASSRWWEAAKLGKRLP
jgi:hypothetical protein